jgi:hypothetical protein
MDMFADWLHLHCDGNDYEITGQGMGTPNVDYFIQLAAEVGMDVDVVVRLRRGTALSVDATEQVSLLSYKQHRRESVADWPIYELQATWPEPEADTPRIVLERAK